MRSPSGLFLHPGRSAMTTIRAQRAALSMTVALSCLSMTSVSTPGFGAIQLDPVVSGLTNPLFVGHAGDNTGRLFIVERGGVIKVLQPGSSTPTVFLNIAGKVLAGNERGLLGLAFHPQYASNGRFFVYYTREAVAAA